MKLYISGPMTGLPEYNYPAFREAAAVLRAKGYEVASPAEIDGGTQVETGEADKKPYEYWLRKALLMQLDCDAWVGMQGWVKSKGAKREFDIAVDLNHRLFVMDHTYYLTEIG